MTDREKAIVMAYTGITTLEGDKLGIYYDYVAELMGRRIATHEIPILLENIKARAYSDFRRICEATDKPVQYGEWNGERYLLGADIAWHKIRLGVMCCYGIDGHGCGDCPYYKAQGLEEMTCDLELADDVLALIGAQAAERRDAGE